MIKKAKWAVKEAQLRIQYKMSKDCLFCKIVKGEVKTDMVLEGENVVVFNDINPVAETHIVIVPKEHIESVLTIGLENGPVLAEMFKVAAMIVKDNKLEGFRLAFNGGKFQHVPHLHMHLLAGNKVEWKRL